MQFLFRSCLITLPLLVLSFDTWARAGGGGSSSGKGGGWSTIILLPIALIYLAYRNHKISKKVKKVKAALQLMERREPQWQEHHLLKEAERIFRETQNAWSDQDLPKLKKLLHPMLYTNWERDIKGQIREGKKNEVSGISVNDCQIVDVKNFINDESDTFTVFFKISCTDSWYQNHSVTSSKASSFEEFWTFEWEKGQWNLRSIAQEQGWKAIVSSPVLYEARRNYKKAG